MNWVILILISAIFISIRNILTKKLLFKNDPLPIMFLISVFSLIGMIFFKTNIHGNLSMNIYILLIIKSIIIGIVWLCLYQAYKHMNISTISPLRNLSPLFLIIFSLIFLGENITFVNYFGIGLLIISAYALEIKSFRNLLEPLKIFKTKFFGYILISLIGSSISATLDKIILKSINYQSILFFFYLFISIFYLGIIFFKNDFSNIKKLFKPNQIVLILLITLSALIADFSYFIAAAIPATLIVLIIPLRRTSTFISTLIGGNFFKEKNIWYKGLICLVMILGVYLIII